MLAAVTSESSGTEARAVHAPAIAATRRVLAVRVCYVTLATLPASVTDTLTSTVLAVTATQRRTYACQSHRHTPAARHTHPSPPASNIHSAPSVTTHVHYNNITLRHNVRSCHVTVGIIGVNDTGDAGDAAPAIFGQPATKCLISLQSLSKLLPVSNCLQN